MGRKLFIAVDPKRRNFFDYEDIDLFKPNLNEILDAYKAEDKSISNIKNVSDKAKVHEKNTGAIPKKVMLSTILKIFSASPFIRLVSFP